MRQRYTLYQRGKTYYCWDGADRKATNPKTRDADAAERIVQSKNEALRQPQVNLQIARAYAISADPRFAQRTWQTVDEATLNSGA